MVTVRIKENSKQAKKFLEYIKTLPFVEFKEEKAKSKEKIPTVSQEKLKSHVLKTFEETDKRENLTSTTSHKDLMDKLFS